MEESWDDFFADTDETPMVVGHDTPSKIEGILKAARLIKRRDSKITYNRELSELKFLVRCTPSIFFFLNSFYFIIVRLCLLCMDMFVTLLPTSIVL